MAVKVLYNKIYTIKYVFILPTNPPPPDPHTTPRRQGASYSLTLLTRSDVKHGIGNWLLVPEV
jgi:hypothetical protein